MHWIKRLLWGLLALIVLVTGVFFTGVALPLSAPKAQPVEARLLVRNVRLVDVETGVIRNGTDLLIEHGRIVAVGTDLQAGDARQLDGGGHYAIPGLFDMHVHSIRLSPELLNPLYVAAGVTAVRDMGGCLGPEDGWVACAPEKRAWNEAVVAGQHVGPRFDAITSLAINGGQEIPEGVDRNLGAPTPEGARQRVAHDAARGIDFLKPYSRLDREAYLALAESARNEGLYLAGHQPLAISGLEAVAAGQRSIEHAFLFLWDCYPGMAQLRATGDVRGTYTDATRRAMVAEHDADRCAELHGAMAAAGTAFVPTHTTRKLDAYALDEAYRNDARLRFIAPPLKMLWLEDADGMAARAGDAGSESYRLFYEAGLQRTGEAHQAGVTVLAGTDAPDSFAFPGSGLHDELEHLSQAGLSPLDALRAATLEPARFLGLSGEAGVLKAGSRGDLVLLRDNPLDDITAVRTVETVVLAGAVYDRPALDGLLASVEASASSWSLWPKFTWQILTSGIMRRQFGD